MMMIRSNYCVWILFSLVGFSSLTGGTEQWNGHNPFPKFSAQSPLSSSSSSQNGNVSPANQRLTYDYSSGFPSGFTQGLPTFDFSGPMAAAGENHEQREPAETENVGFVHGPPEGFPNLEQLGGNFPNFGGSVDDGSHHHQQQHRHQSSPSGHEPQHAYHHNPHSSGSSQPEYSVSGEEEDDNFSLPGPKLNGPPPRIHPNHIGGPGPYHRGGPPPPQLPIQYRNGPNPNHPNHQHYVKESGSSPQSSYPRNYSPNPKKPIVLKVSGKNSVHGQLPPGPPVFYAPSPDMQQSSHQSEDSSRAPSYREYDQAENNPLYNHRFRRSLKTHDNDKGSQAAGAAAVVKTVKEDEDDEVVEDQKMDGSEADTYWELTSPFILFDTYKKPEGNDGHGHSSSNISFVDADGGEQRFFPSFPAPAPYLTGGFGGGPPSRPPLFPGPAANRAPSRHHPHYHGPKFAPPPPPPNRGPSNVYSAESHDHYQDNNLLGSGNFEVVRGGTYYGDDDDGYHGGGGGGGLGFHGHHDDDGDYYHHNHNGHSSPQEGYRVPGQDFFANFRDFADINPPRAFSHHHEALASELRHISTSPSAARQPKNILDKLKSSSPSDHSSRSANHQQPSSSSSSSSSSSLSRESDPMMATF